MTRLINLRLFCLLINTLLVFIAASFQSAQAVKFTRIFTFGDSLVDDGNFFERQSIPGVPALSTPLFPGSPFPNNPYFQGRFSNGPVVTEVLANLLNISQSENFAIGGSTSGIDHAFVPGLSLIFPGLKGQINEFEAQNQVINASDLFVIATGSNDYISLVSDPSSAPKLIQQSVTNISSAVITVLSHGAKKIVVFTLPDLGKIPDNATLPPPVKQQLSLVSQNHNQALLLSLEQLQSASLFPSDAKIIPFEINQPFNQALANPGRFGFTNVVDSCLDSLFKLCDNPDEYLSFDGTHPTARGHQVLGQFLFQAVSPVPEPTTILGSLGCIGMGAFLFRKKKLHHK